MAHPIDEVLFDDIARTIGDRAFPVTIARDGKTRTGTGLTKRELFAAMAMQGFMGEAIVDRQVPGKDYTEATVWAERAVTMADALIAALSKSTD